jgi:hypothetical protein
VRDEPRGEDLAVVAIKTLGSRPRHARRGRSKKATDEQGEPDPVLITRITVIPADSFPDALAAKRWFSDSSKRDNWKQGLAYALKLANRVVHAHRVATADPYKRELSIDLAHRIRIGFGTGDQVAEGAWEQAHAIRPGRSKDSLLDPDPRVAAMLSGRDRARASDDLLLRARIDLDQERHAQAAIQTRAAVQALQLEGNTSGNQLERLELLAGIALKQDLTRQQIEELEQALAELERAAKRRMHGAPEG